MYRIKDPALSIPFYENVFGLTLACKKDFPQWKFSLYFMGTFPAGTEMPNDPASEEAWEWISSLSSTLLELTHNHGTESDPDFKGYHNGNTDPRGFGHVGFLTDNLEDVCKHMEEQQGVKFTKRPHEGMMRSLAFC